MSLELSHVIHTRAEAFEALRAIAARHGRTLHLDPDDRPVNYKCHEQNLKLCDALIDILGAAFGVEGRELRAPTRCRRNIARVRQIGMYVAHTSFGMAMREVAEGFSRDRTTVMHACHLVEDMRDDADFDAVVSSFERIVNSVFPDWRMAA